MAFTFRFERILGYRRHLEKSKMEELAVEQRKLQALQDELHQLLQEQETKLAELRDKEQNAIKIDELLQYLWITASYSHYFDGNDVLVNLVAAAAGLLLHLGAAPPGAVRSRGAPPRLEIAVAVLLAAVVALGFATGNLVGIAVERKIALGFMILRVFTRTAGRTLTERLRAMGQPVTVFQGEGMRGPVDELYIACRRRNLSRILSIVHEEDPESFYITEMARDVCRTIGPLSAECSGWRSVFKRK